MLPAHLRLPGNSDPCAQRCHSILAVNGVGQDGWTLNEQAVTAPVFVWPPRPLAALKWLPGYFFPYNILFFLSAPPWRNWVIPPVEVMSELAWGWVLKPFAVNAVAVFQTGSPAPSQRSSG